MITNIVFLFIDFQSCNFSHGKRIGNSIAHFLARKANSSNELQFWIDYRPDDIALFVIRFVIFLSWNKLDLLGLDTRKKVQTTPNTVCIPFPNFF